MRDEIEIVDGVATAVKTAMEDLEVILTAMYEAVFAYHETKDPEALIDFAEAARVAAIVRSAAQHAKTLENASPPALGKGRSLDEIFAAQPN
jgi:hypothetical protein